MEEKKVDEDIYTALLDLKISSNYKGYNFLVDIIKLKIDNPVATDKELYMKVRDKYNEKSYLDVFQCVTRVVSISNKEATKEIKQKYISLCKYTGGSYTPKLFISGLANYIKLKM